VYTPAVGGVRPQQDPGIAHLYDLYVVRQYKRMHGLSELYYQDTDYSFADMHTSD